MSKYNKELIEKLRSGEIALEYDGKSLEDLRNILKEAFPKNSYKLATGNAKYYGKFSETTWYGSNVIPWDKNVPIKDFIQEEFVLPEKWCIRPLDDEQLEIIYNHVDKNGNSLKRMREAKSTIFYYHFPATNNRDFFAYQKPQKGYTEITFEQFQQHVLKQDNNMKNKEIIGYLVPYDLFGGKVKKGTLYKKSQYNKIYYHTDNGEYAVPKEIVETWESVYKPKEQVFNMGSFEVMVRDDKAFHRSEDITKFVRELIATFHNRNMYIDNYQAIIEDVIFSKTGCENNQTKLSDWRKVYNALNQ